MIKWARIFALTLVSLYPFALLHAQTGQTVKPPAEEETKWVTLKTRVIDPDGHPIEGVAVDIAALKVRGISLLRNERKSRDKVQGQMTDADGLVTVRHPLQLNGRETLGIGLVAAHPNFVTTEKTFNIDGEVAEMEMERGLQIAVSGIDAETEERLTKNLYADTGGNRATWKTKNNGLLVSSPMKQKGRFLRVVELVEGKPARFSDRIEINPSEKSRLLIKDIKIAPGTRVVGKLDDSVTRPVKNGYVIGKILRKPVANPNDQESHLQWDDRAEIKEDGSFVFESLPGDEVLQLIAVCEGWGPAEPNLGDVAKLFPLGVNLNQMEAELLPQVVELKGPEVTVTLNMVPTHRVRVRVVDAEGHVIPGAQVDCFVDQRWFHGGWESYGDGEIRRKFLVEGKRSRFGGRYHVVITDENGVGEFNNLPSTGVRQLKPAGHLQLMHDDYELPTRDGRGGFVNFEFSDSEVTEVTLTVRKKVAGSK